MSERPRRDGQGLAAPLRPAACLAAALLAGGCSHMMDTASNGNNLGIISRTTSSHGSTSYSVPVNPLVPAAKLRLTPSIELPIENLLIGAAIWYFVDPLAPNWEGELKQLSEDTFSIGMRSKRFRSTGGDGEAGRVFRRNAETIVREGGFGGYDVLEYSEGIESELIGAVRYAEGTIRVSRK